MTAPPDAKPSTGPAARISCDERLELHALPGLPLIAQGDDLAALISAGLTRAAITLRDGDILAVTSKVLSRAEGRFVDLRTVAVSEAAQRLAAETGKDARLVELILRESTAVSRKARGVIVVRHRLGFITAHASIDCSNAVPVGAAADSGPWALLLPTDPDRAAEQIRSRLHGQSGAHVGVVITDSLGRPFRIGTVGAAIGVAGLPAIWDRRGETDIYGRKLEITITALADQVAAAADLVAGQASEGRAVVHIRGLKFQVGAHRADELYRRAGEDLYA